MKLYDLTAFELLWERESDTKAMIAWNDGTVVLAFRGTASLRNVLADLQARLSGKFMRAPGDCQLLPHGNQERVQRYSFDERRRPRSIHWLALIFPQ
jgi:hypothetical protein